MGIKNIHIVLIAASSLLGLLFSIWSLSHDYAVLGFIALALAAGLAVYGIKFVQKAKSL